MKKTNKQNFKVSLYVSTSKAHLNGSFLRKTGKTGTKYFEQIRFKHFNIHFNNTFQAALGPSGLQQKEQYKSLRAVKSARYGM